MKPFSDTAARPTGYPATRHPITPIAAHVAMHVNERNDPDRRSVTDKIPKRFLSIERDTENLLPAQSRPEKLLGVGHFLAETAGRRFQVGEEAKNRMP